MKEVKIGLVGVAGWGAKHVLAISNIEGIRVAAIADNAPMIRSEKKTVPEYAASIGAASYTDGVKMIEEADIDAVDLVVAPKWREPLLEACARRKLPVLVEKPLSNNLAQGERFAKIARDAGIPLMMEYPLRFHPAAQRARQLLYDGPLGKPVSVTAELETFWNPPVGHWAWADDVEGGVVTEAGCHILDTLGFLCGKPARVFAMGRNVQGHGKTVDMAAMTIEYDSGATALANIGGIGTFAFNVPMYVKVYAEKGELLLTGENWVFQEVAWATSGKNDKVVKERLEGPPRFELHRLNLMEFARVVRGEIAPPCSAEDGVAVQRVIAAMARSIATARVESVS